MDQEQIQFKKDISLYFKERTIRECFYIDHSECSDKIINAHSIQNNKCLSLLTEKVGSNEGLYSFSKYYYENDGLKLKLIGRNVASTFSGFCSFHDRTLFQLIDNNNFDYSPQQMFLYSYRAFAHSYHRNKEQLKGQYGKSAIIQNTEKEILEETTLGCTLACMDMQKCYPKINRMLQQQDYDNLCYYVYKKKGLFPVAASACTNPAFTPLENENIFFSDRKKETMPLIVTVLPEVSNTYIILAYFKEDSFSQTFVNELKFYFWNEEWIERMLSSLLIFDIENTYISPYIWEKMTLLEQKQLCDEILQSLDDTNHSYFEHFNVSGINLFNSKYLKPF